MSDVLQIIQSAVVLFGAPLYAGVLARAEAMVQCKRGPSVLQPYRDLRKLLHKGSATSDQASWVFQGAPFVAFACYLTVSVIVPIITAERHYSRQSGSCDLRSSIPAGHPPGAGIR